jgi:acetyl esterase/lipase
VSTSPPRDARDLRDPDAIEIVAPEAARYADRVEQLGREAALEPVERMSYGDDRGQWLDVYAPPDARDLPVLLFWHGGAWINGHLGWLRFMAPVVTALPAVFVAATYRLAPRCRWPAQYEDVSAALSLTAAHARRFGGNPENIVVGGHSAGGHLAALVTLRREGPPVRACFPVSSSYDLQYGNVAQDSLEGRVYRYLFADPRQDREASPIEYVAGSRVPFHVRWGGRDFPHIAAASRRIVDALRSTGAPVTTEVVDDASHFDMHLGLGDARNSWYARLRDAMASGRGHGEGG